MSLELTCRCRDVYIIKNINIRVLYEIYVCVWGSTQLHNHWPMTKVVFFHVTGHDVYVCSVLCVHCVSYLCKHVKVVLKFL